MTIVESVILGIVEGITEFLPISSTGHLILANRLLGISTTEFVKSFEIIIQLGAIGAVIWLYWRKILINWEVMKRIVVGFIPTVILGCVFYGTIREFLGSEQVVLWALALGGVALIVFELLHREGPEAATDVALISYRKVFLIGLFQALAFIPGVSRAAATILGGLALGLRRTVAVEFSFLLAVPTMLAASALDVYKNGSAFSSDQFGLLAVGFITAFVVALFAVKFLLRFIRGNNFIPFGIYRIVLAAIFAIFILIY